MTRILLTLCHPERSAAEPRDPRFLHWPERHRVSGIWRREKKISLIKTMNPAWSDLAEHWYTRAAFTGKLERGPRLHF